jgi:hypothetical protein
MPHTFRASAIASLTPNATVLYKMLLRAWTDCARRDYVMTEVQKQLLEKNG